MNEFKLKLEWYFKFLFESKLLFFVMLMFLLGWLVFSNFYLNKKYIAISQIYEREVLETNSVVEEYQIKKPTEDIDLYAFIIGVCSKNKVDVRLFSMSQHTAQFSLVGSTESVKDALFEISTAAREKKINLGKVELSFEDKNHIVLMIQVLSNEK